MNKEKIIHLINLIDEWDFYDKDCPLDEEEYSENTCDFCEYTISSLKNIIFHCCPTYLTKEIILDRTKYSHLWLAAVNQPWRFPPPGEKRSVMTLEKVKELFDLLGEWIYNDEEHGCKNMQCLECEYGNKNFTGCPIMVTRTMLIEKLIFLDHMKQEFCNTLYD